MAELLRRLRARPLIAGELALASLFANLLALASPLFVIQVLNRYVAYGIDATLTTLTAGVLIAIALEFTFRQARLMIASTALSQADESRAVGAFGMMTAASLGALENIPAGQRREAMRGLDSVDAAFTGNNIAAVYDLPFALLFLLALTLLNPILGAIGAAFTLSVFAISLVSRRLLKKPMQAVQARAAEGNALIATTEQAADTLRMFNGGEILMTAWKKYVRDIQGLRRQIAHSQGTSQTVTQTAQGLMGVAIIAVGAVLAVTGQLDVGNMIGANILASRALGPVGKFAQLLEQFAKAEQSLQQVHGLTSLPLEGDEGSVLGRYQGGLELRGMAFSHSEQSQPLYESVDLVLRPGSVLIATGNNASGKTTLAKLIVGLLQPTRGRVLADGVDVRQLAPSWWRRQVVYLPQEPTFLNASIRANLSANNPALDDAGIDAVLRQAGMGQFIDESPHGLDTQIVAQGRTLSVGDRRRLALARALATGGRLAVLDEPTEGLDESGRAAVYGAMKALSERGATVIVFSHDPLILKGARLLLDLNSKPQPTLRVLEAPAKMPPGRK